MRTPSFSRARSSAAGTTGPASVSVISNFLPLDHRSVAGAQRAMGHAARRAMISSKGGDREVRQLGAEGCRRHRRTMGEITAGGLFEAAMSDHVSPMTAAAAMASGRWLWREEASDALTKPASIFCAVIASFRVCDMGFSEAPYSLAQRPASAGHTLVYRTRHLAMLPHRPRRQNQRPRLSAGLPTEGDRRLSRCRRQLLAISDRWTGRANSI